MPQHSTIQLIARGILKFFLVASFAFAAGAASVRPLAPWVADQGDGTYRNPVLVGDYSDPDVVRVGGDFYLTASSFTNVPGLPILHSRDLVNWTIVGHALAYVPPQDHYRTPRRGGGVWAPSIRFHGGRFYIYYPDPDAGIFVVTASNPRGPWSKPVLVDSTRGAIDPAPFWDKRGQAWIVMASARSRSGINNIVTLKRLRRNGLHVAEAGRVIIDGAKLPRVATSIGLLPWTTIEGPKLYWRNGWYYVFAPAGGVKCGWQAVFRSRVITGPYEARNVLDQGGTEINGPHQGAWVDTGKGEDWFLHFQDSDSYGRQVDLEPMMWRDGWPVIGADPNGDERGEPVAFHEKPRLPQQPIAVPQFQDEFDGAPNLAWQWNSNPQDNWIDKNAPAGVLRLTSASSSANLYEAGNLLTEKLPGYAFTATTKVTFTPHAVGERTGVLLFGFNYGWIGLEKTAGGVRLVQVTRLHADKNAPEHLTAGPIVGADTVYLRLSATPVTTPETPLSDGTPPWPSLARGRHAKVIFSYSLEGRHFVVLGAPFTSRQGRWVGAQLGLFAQAPTGTPSNTATGIGHADYDWFRVTP